MFPAIFFENFGERQVLFMYTLTGLFVFDVVKVGGNFFLPVRRNEAVYHWEKDVVFFADMLAKQGNVTERILDHGSLR